MERAKTDETRTALAAQIDTLLEGAPSKVAARIRARIGQVVREALHLRDQLKKGHLPRGIATTASAKELIAKAERVSTSGRDQLKGLSPFLLHSAGIRRLDQGRMLSGDAALVLSGGGAKGSFEVGALAFLESRWDSVTPSVVCGSSVGAINAIAVAQDGRLGIKKLLTVYAGLRSSRDMYRLSSELQAVDDILAEHYNTSVRELLRSGNGTGLPELDIATAGNVALVGGVNFLSTLFLGPTVGSAVFAFLGLGMIENETQEHLSRIKRIVALLKKASSIYTLGPTAEKVRQFLLPDRPMLHPLRMATVDLCTGKTCYVTEDGTLLVGDAAEPEDTWAIDLGLSRPEKIVRGALASSAIPGVFPSVQMRKNPSKVGHFVDGGVREILPSFSAKRLGASKIIAISASPLRLKYLPLDLAQVPMSEAMARGLTIAIDEVASNEHSPPNGWNDTIERIHIFPEIEVHDTLTIEPGLIRINMEYGYMRAFDICQLGMGDEEQSLCAALSAVVATQAIVETRMEVKELERQMIQRLGGTVIIFDPVLLSRVRSLKRTVYDFCKLRLAATQQDLRCIPVRLHGENNGVVAEARSWWERWERHGVAMSTDLDQFGPDPISRTGC